MDLILFGIQGSGKGTQAKRIAAECDFDIFEAGGELRAIAASGTELGEEAEGNELSRTAAGNELSRIVKSYIDVGELVPHQIIMKVVEEAIRKRPKDQKILFDGIPRDSEQKKDFDAVMEKLGREFHCIQIELSPEEGVRRLLKRAKIEGRADDASEETIRKRMQTFLEKTFPVIEQYKEQGMLTVVDGHGSVEEISEKILQILS